jgi:hypothetical protein
MDIYEQIQNDIDLIEPNADKRIYNTRQRKLKAMREYGREYYIKHKEQLREQAREKYSPAIQSPDDHAPIDYDIL